MNYTSRPYENANDPVPFGQITIFYAAVHRLQRSSRANLGRAVASDPPPEVSLNQRVESSRVESNRVESCRVVSYRCAIDQCTHLFYRSSLVRGEQILRGRRSLSNAYGLWYGFLKVENLWKLSDRSTIKCEIVEILLDRFGGALLSFVNRFFFFFGEGERGQEREIGKDDKSKDGESFGNKGIASCSVFISNRFIERRFLVNL